MPFPPRYFNPRYWPERYWGPGQEGVFYGDLDATEAADAFAATGYTATTGVLAASEAQDTAAFTGTLVALPVEERASKGGYVSRTTRFRDKPTEPWLIVKQKLEWLFDYSGLTMADRRLLYPIFKDALNGTARYPKAPVILAALAVLDNIDGDMPVQEAGLRRVFAALEQISAEEEWLLEQVKTLEFEPLVARPTDDWEVLRGQMAWVFRAKALPDKAESALWATLKSAYHGTSQYSKAATTIAANRMVLLFDGATDEEQLRLFTDLIEAYLFMQEEDAKFIAKALEELNVSSETHL